MRCVSPRHKMETCRSEMNPTHVLTNSRKTHLMTDHLCQVRYLVELIRRGDSGFLRPHLVVQAKCVQCSVQQVCGSKMGPLQCEKGPLCFAV